jgi:hypothetical protein
MELSLDDRGDPVGAARALRTLPATIVESDLAWANGRLLYGYTPRTKPGIAVGRFSSDGRRIEDGPVRLPGGTFAAPVGWFDDGRLAYRVHGELWSIVPSGGEPQRLATDVMGAFQVGDDIVVWKREGAAEGESPLRGATGGGAPLREQDCRLVRLSARGEERGPAVARPPGSVPCAADVRCASSAPDVCVVSDASRGGAPSLSFFDVTTGARGKSVYEGPVRGWAISGDGDAIAVTDLDDQLTLVDVATGSTRRVAVKPKGILQEVSYIGTTGRIVVGAVGLAERFALFGTDESGQADLLWKSLTTFFGVSVVSRDGRSFAGIEVPIEEEVLLLEPP